tara:strand:- start:11346 stop:11546 length:201 start_codon:yes stop_codon:yes gene_type:complete
MTDKDDISLNSDGVLLSSSFCQEMAMPHESVIVSPPQIEFDITSLEFHGRCIDDIAGPADNFELIY